MQIILKTMPITTNSMYAHTGRYRFLTSKAKENKESMGHEAIVYYRNMPLQGNICLSVALYWKDNRNHDIDNIKSLLDAMKGILWVDDSQIIELHVTKSIDKLNPRVELNIKNI